MIEIGVHRRDALLIFLTILALIQSIFNYQYLTLVNEIKDSHIESTIEGTLNVNDTIHLNLFDTYEVENPHHSHYLSLTFVGFTYEREPILGIRILQNEVYYEVISNMSYRVPVYVRVTNPDDPVEPYGLPLTWHDCLYYYDLNMTAYGLDNDSFLELERFAWDEWNHYQLNPSRELS